MRFNTVYTILIFFKGGTPAYIKKRFDVKNNGDAFLGSLKLTQNNVFYNSDNTKITKLKITQ